MRKFSSHCLSSYFFCFTRHLVSSYCSSYYSSYVLPVISSSRLIVLLTILLLFYSSFRHLVLTCCPSYYSYIVFIIRFALSLSLSLTHTHTQLPVLTVKVTLTSKFCCCVFFLHFETIWILSSSSFSLIWIFVGLKLQYSRWNELFEWWFIPL
jgi:hypothetical protein